MAVGKPGTRLDGSEACARCRRRPRTTGKRASYCLECQRELNRISLMKRPTVQAVLAAKDGPCVDCGVQLPAAVMELDHVRGKSFALAQAAVARRRLEDVLAEIAKCELRCPNCHRMRHYREWNQAWPGPDDA